MVQWKRRWFLLLWAWSCLSAACVGGEAEEDLRDRLPRIAPKSPAEALESFQVAEGFRIELAAAEPLVVDPVALAFDEQSRLYVVEMCDYSEDDRAHLGRIRLLTDHDGDGRFETGSLYAEGLSWPTAVICWEGGVFVGAPPDIWYLKDTTGDGRADHRERVFTGFSRANVQGMLNSFRWGIDNRIHAATGISGAVIARADLPPEEAGPPLPAGGRDFSFDPRTRELRLESGGAQHGMSFDAWGRKFATSNSDHLQLVMYEERDIARNPLLAAPSPRLSIAADGPAAPVFRASPVEPWRIVRTELRVAGAVPGPIEGGGKPAGYFTGATGVVIYTGNAWPARWRGTAIVGDVGSNLIHRKRLEPAGAGFRGVRVDARSEFVASSDIWFRPCQFANAPDGTLYAADMYREVIEHPKSLPPVIKRHLDLTSGRDRGRIYRIVPEGFTQPPLPNLAAASTAELVALLAHENGWHRETAARLLYAKQDREAVPLLERLANESPAPLGRMHALHALAGLGALRPEILGPRLADEHAGVRAHAVRLAGERANDHAELRELLHRRTEDEDAFVRYQLAFALGEAPSARTTVSLARLAQRDAADRWMRLAILSSSAGRAGVLLAELAGDAEARRGRAVREFLVELAELAGRGGAADEVAAVLHVVEQLPEEEPELAPLLIAAVSRGLAKGGSPLREQLAAGRGGEVLRELLRRAAGDALDSSLPESRRTEAVAALALGDFTTARPVLAALLSEQESRGVQAAALAALGRFREEQVAELVLSSWGGMSPAVRREAAETLFAREERLWQLLHALERQRVSVSEFEPARLQLLREHANERLAARAREVLGEQAAGRRSEVVAAHREVLQRKGDVDRGRAAFRKACAACHRLEGEGHALAPDLAAIRNRGAEAILLSVLDPNREVNPQYLNYVVTTRDGRSRSGVIAAETANSLTLARGEGQSDTLLRSEIEELRSTGLSIMPEGLEQQLTRQELADVIAYLLALP